MLTFVLMFRQRALYFCIVLLAVAACSTTRSLGDGEYLLRKNRIVVNEKSVSPGELSSYVSQKPNSYLLGLNPFLFVYNWGGDGSTGVKRFWKKIGEAPVVYDPLQVDKSIGSIQNHLRYIGYYGSQVESRVEVKKRQVYVTYYVALGRRYKISSIDYDIPKYGTFKEDFQADLPNSTIAVGQYLSESALEAEAERSSRYFRNQGYYGFTKTFYALRPIPSPLTETPNLRCLSEIMAWEIPRTRERNTRSLPWERSPSPGRTD